MPPKEASIKSLSRAFRALSHPNRLQLFVNLWQESKLDLAHGRTHECFLGSLLTNLRIGAPTISHHVRELEDAGLITTSREGKLLACAINPEMVRTMRALFDGKM
jgi:DNA-binding transcriptional ArsR family regulator